MDWIHNNFLNFLKQSAILITLLLGAYTFSFAQTQQTHTVKAGETLFSISKSYDVAVEKLRDWNNLSGNELSVGQTLVVGQSPGKQPENGISHEVKPQETLFSISKQYGVTIAELKQWNSLSSNNLEVGQQITIYPPDDQSKSMPASETSLVANTTTSQNTYYTVKSGDSLYKIANQHNMTIDELKQLNDLTSNTIRVGQRLTVRKSGQAAPSVAESGGESTPQGSFAVHTVASGSSLQAILRKFNMSEEEFRALNPDAGSSLQAGQEVTVLLPPTRTYKNPYTIQANLKDLGQTAVSGYDASQKGTTTTSGELYNPNQLTAAHSNIALGNVIFVQNPNNNKGVYVRINDRFTGNGLKLSQAALQSLDLNASSNATVNMFQDQ